MSKIGGRKVIHSQSREIVANVVKFMTEEAKKGEFIISPKRIIERVSAATGLSQKSITRIKKEATAVQDGSLSSFSTPNKQSNRPKPVTGLDNFNLTVIRNTVNNFYMSDKSLPSVYKLLIKLKDGDVFHGSSRSLRRILKVMGFKWTGIPSSRSVLVERHDIQYQRFNYLNKIDEFRKKARPIVYLDETYIHTNHVNKKIWVEKTSTPKYLKKPLVKGDRTIILNAGGAMGFIKNSLTMWKSNTTTGDYHHQMNFSNFSNWLHERLIPNLPPSSVIVLDNAPYHNVIANKAPNSNDRKQTMVDWLRENNISFPENALKVQLYQIILENKRRLQKFSIDEILRACNHDVLRLPPYHPELNPIELIWADVKNWVAANNVTFQHEKVIELCNRKFNSIGPEQWKPKIDNCLKWENKYKAEMGILENAIEPFIIQLGDVDTTDDSGSLDSDSEEDVSETDTETVSGIQPLSVN